MPMPTAEIERSLKALRLSGMRATLELRALEAAQRNLPFIEAFALLIQDELDRRRTNMIERRLAISGLQERPTLNDMDWGFNPRMPKKACFELLSLKFIQKGDDALLIGSPGTGKSLIAQIVAHAAIQAGFKVSFCDAHSCFDKITEATELGSRKRFMRPLLDADLLVLDDLFIKRRLAKHFADDLQEIVMNRYKTRRSTMITSNRVLEDWGTILNDTAVAGAILDRLLHHGMLLKFQGPSYRLKDAAARLAKSAKEV